MTNATKAPPTQSAISAFEGSGGLVSLARRRRLRARATKQGTSAITSTPALTFVPIASPAPRIASASAGRCPVTAQRAAK